jgi:hypothetical protein
MVVSINEFYLKLGTVANGQGVLATEVGLTAVANTRVSLRSETLYNDRNQVAIERTNIRQWISPTGVVSVDDSNVIEVKFFYDSAENQGGLQFRYQEWPNAKSSSWLERILQNSPPQPKLNVRADSIATVPFGQASIASRLITFSTIEQFIQVELVQRNVL